PAILDEQSPYDQYTEWKEKIEKTWKEYDEDFLPEPVMDLCKNIAETYKGDPDGYLHLANTAIRLAFLFLPIPGGQTAAWALNLTLNKIVGIFFPPQHKSLFEQIKDAVSKLVDKKLINQETDRLIFKLDSLQQPLSRFSNSIQRAIGKPQDFETRSSNTIILYESLDCSQHKDCSCSENMNRPPDAPLCDPCACRMKEVQNTFSSTSGDVHTALTDMKTTLNNAVDKDNLRDYMQIHLPLYTTAATIELQMYKTYIDFAQKFNFDITGTTKEYVNELRQKIKMHSEYIMGLFKDHLPHITYNTKKQVHAYIKYTRNITLNSLDMVSTWKFLDPIDYPTTATFNPTRIIFNDLAGPVECLNSTQNSDELHFNFLDMKGNFLPNNDIFNYFYQGMQIQSLQIETYTSPNSKNKQYYPTGFLSSYYDNNSNFLYKKITNESNHSLGHDVYQKYPTLSIINAISTQIQIFMNYIDTEDLYFDYPLTIPPKDPDKPNNTVTCPSGNSKVWPDQKIQAIYPISPDNPRKYTQYFSESKIGFVTTLVSSDTTPWITFTDNSDNTIYTFSAENTRVLIGSAEPVREFITGSAPLRLSSNSGAEYSIDTNDAPSGDYQVRVHVATDDYSEDGSLSISVDGKTQILKIPDTKINNTNGIIGFSGTYTLAPATQMDIAGKLKTPTENIFPVRKTSSLPVSIINNSSAVIYLDRIEFIPVSVNPTSSIHIKIPKTITKLNKEPKKYWSGKKYATGLSITGTISNNASVSIELYDGKNLVHSIPINGPGPSHGISGCRHNESNINQQYQHPEIPKYNRLVLKENSDEIYHCSKGFGENTYQFDMDILFDTLQSNFSSVEDLKQITQQVYALFKSSSRTELASNISSCQINQVAIKVSSLSTEIFGKEKVLLRKLVNKAKQFLKALNLLVGGDFETLNGWLLGTKATVSNNSALFKGNYLFLQPTNGIDSSYAYQKVDESKLKPFTRYKISGFIAQSQKLELIISRYGKEIHKIFNIPFEEVLPISPDFNPNLCKPSLYQYPSCNDNQPKSHFFNYRIDVGNLYPDLNPGIEFGLRLAHPSGNAKISNLEIVEERPLTKKEIHKIQRKEEKWKKAWDKEHMEISALLQPIINQINTFYKNENWNSDILPHVTYQDLYNITLPKLPKLRHWFMKNREGEHYGILQQLKQALERVFTHLEEQNLIHNGNFTNGLSDWLVEGDVNLTNLGNGNLALQFSHWDASVSQSINISDFNEDREYILRVRGKGKGNITIQNGEKIKIMSFEQTNFYFKERPFYFEEPSFYLQIQSENNEFIVDSLEIIEIPEEE
ncbi:delta endotoxin C-terminal domain-containing protein, partial [Bacillus thuringiensis]